MIDSVIQFLQLEEIKFLWGLISTIGGWFFSIGIIKWAVFELTAPRLEIFNVRTHFTHFPQNAEDKLIIQYRIKNNSFLGKINPLPKSIQNYTFGYWFKKGSSVYKIVKNQAKEDFFIPYGESIEAIETIEMFFTSNTDYEMILLYQMGDRVLCYKSLPVHVGVVPDKEDWVYNQRDLNL